jgi:hypothetical protein
MTESPRLEDEPDVAADREADADQPHAEGPVSTGDGEPLAEPEVRTAPDEGAIHWHTQLEPGIPPEELNTSSVETTNSH